MKTAEDVRIKITRLSILENRIDLWDWDDEMSEDFYERWIKRLRQYKINVIESYAKEQYEKGFKDGKEVQKGWDSLRNSGLDKPFITPSGDK